tara:strand:+ start:9383 stop:10315 length:933 start_codon:yes stop_codon:yes gene_type:complete
VVAPAEPVANTALQLRYYQLACDIRFLKSVELAAFAGPTLHGGFGHAVKQVGEAFYDWFFDCKNQQGQSIQKPYAFILPTDKKRNFAPQDDWSFTLMIWGDRTQAITSVIEALLHWQTLGLGSARAPFKIQSLRLIGSEQRLIYLAGSKLNFSLPQPRTLLDALQQGELKAGVEPANTVWLNTLSPLHLKHQRQVIKNAPEVDVFLSSIARRINTLAINFEPDDNLLPLVAESLASSVQLLHDNTHSAPVSRYSLREQKQRHIETLEGSWFYHGDIAALMPWMILADVVGMGNKTTFGFGRVSWQLARTA